MGHDRTGSIELMGALARGEAGAVPVDAAPFAAAVLGGARARGVSGAFLWGYQAALRALVPSLPRDRPACLCATEAGGAHPRAIAARLEPDAPSGAPGGALSDARGRSPGDGARFLLSGHKRWATAAPLVAEAGGVYLVVASVGQSPDGRNALRLARVDARAPGITLQPMPEAAFVPELPHAELIFDRTPVEELLPGDGYARYLKPFRTVEDAHVLAAVLAYLASAARRHGWPRAFEERLFAALAVFVEVAAADPTAPATHLVLAGAIELTHRVVAEAAPLWAAVDGDDAAAERDAWQRDVALLSVAARARAARTEAAWQALRP